MNATRPISRFYPRFAQNRYMYRIDGCVSSPLIQYTCKSVQSSFDNCSINTVYSCTLKLKWLGKGLLSLTKYGPISRTAVFLIYRRKRYLMKQSGHCTRISETGKGLWASAPSLFARSCPLWLFPILEAQEKPRWKQISNMQKSGFGYFSVSEQYYLEKIMKTHLKIGLKDWNFVYHMVARILKDWDKDFGIVC